MTTAINEHLTESSEPKVTGAPGIAVPGSLGYKSLRRRSLVVFKRMQFEACVEPYFCWFCMHTGFKAATEGNNHSHVIETEGAIFICSVSCAEKSLSPGALWRTRCEYDIWKWQGCHLHSPSVYKGFIPYYSDLAVFSTSKTNKSSQKNRIWQVESFVKIKEFFECQLWGVFLGLWEVMVETLV